MIYRNSVVSPNGYLYNIVVVQTIPEIFGKEQPACVHDGEGIILIYNDIILDVYGPDSEANTNRSWYKSCGYTPLDESAYSYFSWWSDSEAIHINHESPYIYWDSTNGEAAYQGIVVTKRYTPQAGDVSPFQGTAITGVQSTASTNAVVGGGEYYFEGCTYLREIVMHNAEFFGAHCFDGCTSLEWMDVASKCTFGEDCFANGAGVIRGVIAAASKTTIGEPWELTDIPQSLRDKGWKVIQHDGTELSDYWQVEAWSDTMTITPTPAWTTFVGHDGAFATNNGTYSLEVTNIPEGSSLVGWYVSAKSGGYYIEDETNPREFTFNEDIYIEPLTELPQPKGFYTVTFGANDPTMGSVVATLYGKEIASPCSIYEGEEVAFTAVANTGYHFVQWSDGNEHGSVWQIINSDYTIEAIFEADNEEEPKKEFIEKK